MWIGQQTWEVADMVKANQDIRDYMADHGVTQRDLAREVGTNQCNISKALSNELSQQDKEVYLNLIDSIAQRRDEEFACDEPVEETSPMEETAPVEEENCEDESPKFLIGDRVIIPSKTNKVGTVTDIWTSLAKAIVMYTVQYEEDGYYGMYAEDQLEPAPIPTTYTFNAVIDGNAAVVTMNATQGDKTWVFARGHAHILHDGEVGMAQAVSYAARRMFESLDIKQQNKIYFKGEK